MQFLNDDFIYWGEKTYPTLPGPMWKSKWIKTTSIEPVWQGEVALKQYMTPRSKEIQEQMKNKVIDIDQSGKGSKAIFEALGLQRTTVRLQGL